MPTALIIDDSPLARRMIRHHLSKIGCEVVGEAENAAQALRLFSQLRPELVTLDLMMPAVDGVDSQIAFQRMRADKPDLLVIIASSVPFEKVRDSYLKDGALAYLIKPFNQFSFEPVRQKLMRALRRRAA